MPAGVGLRGQVATVARYDDEVEWAKKHGVDTAFNIYAGAGSELADQAAGLSEPFRRPTQSPDAG